MSLDEAWGHACLFWALGPQDFLKIKGLTLAEMLTIVGIMQYLEDGVQCTPS